MKMINYVNINAENDFLVKTSSGKSIKPLYKYMSLELLLKILNDNVWYFVNPTKWNDPFEKRFLEASYSNIVEFPWSSRVFCSCFTSRASSEAHWMVHGNTNVGVELHIDREKLLNLLKSLPADIAVYIGEVEYKTTKDIIKHDIKQINFKPSLKNPLNNNEVCSRLLLLKRNAFRYEEEIRVMLVHKEKQQSLDYDVLNNGNGFRFADLIQSIVLSPFIGAETNEIIRNYFEQNYPNIKIKNSHLYSDHYSVKRPLKWI